ncbi:MAG: acetyl-CoA carboxylase biotin carboxyl carrier protein [Acidobacteriaceae bacterium]
MNAGQLQTLKELIEFLKQQEVGEFELEQDDLKVHLTFAGHEAAAAQAGGKGNVDLSQMAHWMPAAPPAAPAQAPPAAAAPTEVTGISAAAQPPSGGDEAGLHIVKSPIVGTFYEAPSPGAEAFVKIGDQVESGQVICIVEAMKLMNEIECDAAGEIVKRMVTAGQPVEYGQALFAIRRR